MLEGEDFGNKLSEMKTFWDGDQKICPTPANNPKFSWLCQCIFVNFSEHRTRSLLVTHRKSHTVSNLVYGPLSRASNNDHCEVNNGYDQSRKSLESREVEALALNRAGWWLWIESYGVKSE